MYDACVTFNYCFRAYISIHDYEQYNFEVLLLITLYVSILSQKRELWKLGTHLPLTLNRNVTPGEKTRPLRGHVSTFACQGLQCANES